MWACKLGFKEIVEILLKKGADLSLEDNVCFSLSIFYMITQYAD